MMTVFLAAMAGALVGNLIGNVAEALFVKTVFRRWRKNNAAFVIHDPTHPPLDFMSSRRKRQSSRWSN